MKKTHKIIISFLIIAIVGTIVIPTLEVLSEKLGLNSSSIFNILAKLADSTVVNASGDYKYGGNLTVICSRPGSRFEYEYSEEENKGFHFYTSGFCRIDDEENRFTVIPEYSINGAEFVQSTTQQGSVSLNLDKDVNTLVARLPDSKDIIYKAMLVKYKDSFIVFQNSVCTRLEFSTGDRIYYVNEDGITEDRYDLEYSMDNGETFNKLKVQEMWYYVFPVEGGTLFNNKVIIREKDTRNIIYETPTLGDIEEDVIYENGKTTVKLKTNGTQNQNNIEFSYEVDGQEAAGNVVEVSAGNVVEVSENTNITLRAKANIEFSEKLAEKEIEIKVIKTEKPTIETDNENNLEIMLGNIENDEVENIYYSVDDGEPIVYTEKIALDLEPGEHSIKAYQVTSNGVESEISEENVTIEEKEAEEEQDDEENKGEETENKTIEEESETKENSEDDENIEDNDTNKESKDEKENKVSEKEEKTGKNNKSNKVGPQTGDKVIIFASIITIIVVLNVIIKRKK